MSDIPTQIIRSKRRSLALTITPDATLIVKAPHFMPQFFINQFVKSHQEWIDKQIAKLGTRPAGGAKKYEDGETFLYLGQEVKFAIGNYKEITIKDNKLLFPEFMMFRAQKQLITWYRKQAEMMITKQVKFYAEKMKTSFSGLTFSDTKSQWGSCSPDNKLQFSWRLIMTPYMTMNYVIVHELAHTIQKNHSRKFWEIVALYNPSYNTQRKWLKKNGHSLIV